MVLKADLDWKNLDFSYRPSDFNIRFTWKDGAWDDGVLTPDDHVHLHMAATCLHYGQECFEGLKVFETRSGDAVVFRIEENARRMVRSCRKVLMAPPSEEMFIEACYRVVRANLKYIPPFGTGASLYLRPLVIGTGPRVGVKPADEYMFMVFVTPVGPYFKSGFKPVNMVVEEDVDRAAPLGVGDVKVGGNYAAGMRASMNAKDRGFTEVIFLDAKEKRYIDESGPANFFVIKNGQYITPQSGSILPSITNMSLFTLAEEMGLNPIRRPVEIGEVFDCEEAGCCGTAAVITPIGSITWRDRVKTYGDGVTPGPVSTELYHRLQAIQNGELPDNYGWVRRIPLE